MQKIVAKVLITMLALLITAAVIPGITVTGIWAGFWAALILAVLNVIVKPIFTILTLPLTILTLGLFLFVINGIMLMLAAYFISGFYVSGLLSAIVASVFLTIISSIIQNLMD